MICECPVEHPDHLNTLALKAAPKSLDRELEVFRQTLSPEQRTSYRVIEDALCEELTAVQLLTAIHYCRQCQTCPHK